MDQAGELRSARIESLRAVAALGVLIGHVAVVSPDIGPAYVDDVLLGGGFGVYLFFTLSGYLLFWPFARRDYGQRSGGREAKPSDGESIDLRRYAFNRALRILPLYYLVLVVLLIVKEGGGTFEQWVVFASFSENFTSGTLPQAPETVNGVMWSLVVELHFYALLPLLALALARLSRRSLVRAALLLGALAAASATLRLFTYWLDDTPNLYVRFSIFSLFFFFVSGMVLALLRVAWRDGPPAWLRGPLGSSSAWCAGALGLMLVVWREYYLEGLTAVAGFLLVGACVLPLRHGRVVRALEWRWLAAVGVASYSLYLWHAPIVLDLIGPGHLGFLGLLAVGGAASLGVAFVSYRLVEVPFLRLRRRWARSSPAPSPPLQRAGS